MSQEWFDKCNEMGEQAANQELARQLRMAADFIEKNDWPKVYAAEMLPTGSNDLPDFIARISVTLSYPWPG